jgi:RNA polymerase sigma-70 factor (ECF subfamily)
MATGDDHNELDGLRDLDARVLAAVYDRYFPAVYRYVCYRFGDGSLAEDLTSEVFVRLLESCHAGRAPQTNLKGWLLSTSAHAVNDHFRRAYRHPTAELNEDFADSGTNPVEDVELRERQRKVRGALSHLTGDQQHVIVLRFGQGFSLEETAQAMKKKVNAIKQLQLRALAALGRKMGSL